MASPAFIFDGEDFARLPFINVSTNKETPARDVAKLRHYVLLQRAGPGGQLSLSTPLMWTACLAALSDVRGPTGWTIQAGPHEAIWVIRTPSDFEELRWMLSFRFPGEVEWALFDVESREAYRSNWDIDDWRPVYAALDAWADRHEN